jgi:formylglycine-generating enzyme required for sulfatase activity
LISLSQRWNGIAGDCRVAYRYDYVPSNSVNYIGIRVARSSVQ